MTTARVQVLEHPLRHPLTLAAESHTEDARQSGEDNDEHDTLGPLRAEGPAMGLRLGSGSKVDDSQLSHAQNRKHEGGSWIIDTLLLKMFFLQVE